MRTLFAMTCAALSAGCLDLGQTDVQMKLAVDPYLQPGDPSYNPPPNPDDPVGLGLCDVGLSYQGFGSSRLEVGRDEEEIGMDRDRVKPLSALTGEYARVLGAPPALLGQLTNTFGATPPRWFVEPEATAVSLFSSMRVAFVGCLDVTATADYDDVPDAANAPEKCTAFAERFWSRTPDADELSNCVEVATTAVGQEPQARRKWAYVCASVLSSAPFLTY